MSIQLPTIQPLSKYYGAHCSEIGCTNDPHSWCERFGQNPGDCTDGSLGDIEKMAKYNSMSWDEFQKAMAASTTKFRLNYKNELVEVGLFLSAGCMIGDRLEAIDETFTDGRKMHTMALHKEEILKWEITAPIVHVMFERNGEMLMGSMPNPALIK